MQSYCIYAVCKNKLTIVNFVDRGIEWNSDVIQISFPTSHTVDWASLASLERRRRECKCIPPRITVLTACTPEYPIFHIFRLIRVFWIIMLQKLEYLSEAGISFPHSLNMVYRVFPSCLLCSVFLEMGQMQNSICGTFLLGPSFRRSAKCHQDPLKIAAG